MPFSLISLMRFPGLVVASKWNVYWLAPAAAMGFTHCSGRDTIMCMSAWLGIKSWHSSSSLHSLRTMIRRLRAKQFLRVFTHQKTALDQLTSLDTLPLGVQMWCWGQSAFKCGKQQQSLNVTLKLWGKLSYITATRKLSNKYLTHCRCAQEGGTNFNNAKYGWILHITS